MNDLPLYEVTIFVNNVREKHFGLRANNHLHAFRLALQVVNIKAKVIEYLIRKV